MITSIANKKEKRIEIDLTGPDGNVFALLSIGMGLCDTVNQRRGNKYIDKKELIEKMTSGDYENAINTMEEYFGHLIVMYR